MALMLIQLVLTFLLYSQQTRNQNLNQKKIITKLLHYIMSRPQCYLLKTAQNIVLFVFF